MLRSANVARTCGNKLTGRCSPGVHNMGYQISHTTLYGMNPNAITHWVSKRITRHMKGTKAKTNPVIKPHCGVNIYPFGWQQWVPGEPTMVLNIITQKFRWRAKHLAAHFGYAWDRSLITVKGTKSLTLKRSRTGNTPFCSVRFKKNTRRRNTSHWSSLNDDRAVALPPTGHSLQGNL